MTGLSSFLVIEAWVFGPRGETGVSAGGAGEGGLGAGFR